MFDISIDSCCEVKSCIFLLIGISGRSGPRDNCCAVVARRLGYNDIGQRKGSTLHDTKCVTAACGDSRGRDLESQAS